MNRYKHEKNAGSGALRGGLEPMEEDANYATNALIEQLRAQDELERGVDTVSDLLIAQNNQVDEGYAWIKWNEEHGEDTDPFGPMRPPPKANYNTPPAFQSSRPSRPVDSLDSSPTSIPVDGFSDGGSVVDSAIYRSYASVVATNDNSDDNSSALASEVDSATYVTAPDDGGGYIELSDKPVRRAGSDEDKVVFPKGIRGEAGEKKHTAIMTMATAEPDDKLKFGVQPWLQTKMMEDEEGDEAFKHVQDILVSNSRKVDNAVKHLKRYDMFGIFYIKNFITATFCCLWLCWEKCTFDQAKKWQSTLTSYIKDPQDLVSMKWAMEYLEKSCTESLRYNISIIYDKLPVDEQGPVTYAFLILHSVFTLTDDSIVLP